MYFWEVGRRRWEHPFRVHSPKRKSREGRGGQQIFSTKELRISYKNVIHFPAEESSFMSLLAVKIQCGGFITTIYLYIFNQSQQARIPGLSLPFRTQGIGSFYFAFLFPFWGAGGLQISPTILLQPSSLSASVFLVLGPHYIVSVLTPVHPCTNSTVDHRSIV